MANTEVIKCDYAGCDKPFAYRVGQFNLCINHIQDCGCITCYENRPEFCAWSCLQPGFRYACEICGNKRCPHHTDHNLACTNSNESGQKGSVYARG